MARNRSEIIVGLFVLIVLAVAGYIILAIQGNPFEKTFPISAMYTRVVPRPDLRMIEVRMALAESYQSAILNDATATIVPVGFLGDVMVEITYGRLGVPIRPGEILEGGEPFDWQHMIKGAASDFSHAMQSVDRVVGNEKYQEDLGKILDNLSRFTDTLNNLVIPEDRAQLDQIFASLKEMSGKIGDAAGSLQALIEDNRENLSTSLANARTISEQVKGEVAPQFSEAARTFADLGTRMTALTEKIDTFVEANSVNAGEAITGIKESTRSLRETLDTAKTSLERLNEGPGTLHDLLYREETSRELNATLRRIIPARISAQSSHSLHLGSIFAATAKPGAMAMRTAPNGMWPGRCGSATMASWLESMMPDLIRIWICCSSGKFPAPEAGWWQVSAFSKARPAHGWRPT